MRIVNESSLGMVENPVTRVLREGKIVGLANHTVLIARNGKEVAIDDSAAPIFGRDGSLVGVVLAFRDVTEAREAERRLSLALAAGRMGVYEMDLAQNVLWLSPESHALLGTTPKDFSPSPELFVNLVHPQDREFLLQHIKVSIEAHEALNHEFRILRPDGKECWISWQGQIEYNESKRAVRHSGLLIDVTSRKQGEQMLRRFERLPAAARLSAAMTHEINNPLAGLVNLIYLAKTVPGTSESVIQLLASAEQELERVAHAARQTLGFYRDSSAPEQIDLLSLIESVLELYSIKLVSKQVSIERAFGECAPIHGVRGEIRQAVSHVIANAIDAVAKGGVIVIGVQSVPGDKEVAAEIVIADNGPGIAAADVDKVFEPFFTTKGGTGMGLGLWVAKDIVERHGGTITVSCREEGSELPGATFTLRLPHRSALRKDFRPDFIEPPREPEPEASRVKGNEKPGSI
jgi:PAS domain S-box-containing protein